jgi:transposase-like protein
MRKSPIVTRSAPPVESPPQGGGERSEPTPSGGLSTGASVPPTEVAFRGRRRTFTAQYKLEVLQALDACRAPGEVGEILRREGLYSSHLAAWRQQRKKGALAALSDVHRGRKGRSAEQRENERLQKENVRLNRKLERVYALLEIQKKIAVILGVPLNPNALDEIDS